MSNLISIKGSFIRNKDSVSIEWQKNSWIPSLKMKLIMVHKKNPQKPRETKYLVGNGWKLVKLESQ